MMQSIMKYFDLKPYHETLFTLDEKLNRKDYQHVVLLVLDGLGYENLIEHLDEHSFMRMHFKKSLSTVFPPTTTAATTSLVSGLYPSEHGWLGWNVYVSEVDDTVTLFRNESKYKHDKNYEVSVGNTYLHYDSIVDRINSETVHQAYSVSPFGDTPYNSGDVESMVQNIIDLCNEDEKSYIYAYYEEPDGLMHHYGNQSTLVHQKILLLDEILEDMCSELQNTLVLVCADHGHIDVENLFIEDYPELEKMLLRETSIEPRACNFYIKEEYKDAFPILFNEILGDDFRLISKEEAHTEALFGPYVSNKIIKGIGDYIAVALTHYTLNDSRKNYAFKSHHAGGTQREMIIPFMVIDRY